MATKNGSNETEVEGNAIGQQFGLQKRSRVGEDKTGGTEGQN